MATNATGFVGVWQDESLLTPQEAAADLRVSKSYLDKLRVYGGGPQFLRLGRKVLYRKSDLDFWAAQHRFKLSICPVSLSCNLPRFVLPTILT
jgi:excisionase family DNA binding protein